MIKDLALALEYVNRLGIVHGAVRPAAVMLTEHGVVKLAAFECSRLVGAQALDNSLAHPRYASPEVFAQQPAASCMDVWALGCVGYEMLVGVPPFAGTTLDDVRAAVCEDDVAFPSNAEDFDHLLATMLVKDPGQRMPLERLSEHPRLRGASRGMPPRDSSFSVSEHDGKLSEVREEDDDDEEAADDNAVPMGVGSRRRVQSETVQSDGDDGTP